MKSSLLRGLLLRLAVPGVLTILLLITSVFGFFIPLLEDSLLQGRKETARELTGTVQTLLQSYADLVPQQATLDEAQSMAISHIQNLRYGKEGKDYFWINDMHPTMIMHPYRLELNGTDLTDFKDETGKRPFVEFVKAVSDDGAGFVEYSWWWQDSERVEEKLSFVQGFEPWGWIVGTGLYLDDVRDEVALLKNQMVMASSILLLLIGLLVLFMTRQHFLAEKNRTIAENILRQSEQKFRGVFDNANHLAAILDTEGVLLEVNEAALAIIGGSRKDVVGKKFEDNSWWHKDHNARALIRKALNESLDGVVSVEEIQYKLSGHSSKTMILTVGPIFDENGVVVRLLAEGLDISERRLLEEKLRQSQKMESLGQLAGGIAHDFNNLLAAILGNASLLIDSDKLDGEDLECLEQIIVASNRSADLTRQLLSFSRKGKLRHSVVDLHLLLREVAALLIRSIDRRISISLELEAERPFVDGDPAMLHNALLNLGVNARDAMSKLPPEARLNDQLILSTTEVFLDKKSASLRSEQLLPGWYVQIVVSDTGCGIDPKIIDRIFEPFFITKKDGNGTGLGLAGVYGCVKSHKGALTVESKPNLGTSFTLLFPRSLDTAKPPPAGGAPVVGQGGKILFVDDDETLRLTMSRTLDRLGYESVTCSDGLEAVEYYGENKEEIDLIILDLIMDRMGGEEAFSHLMAINPKAKILISSGFARNHLVEELIKGGACGFLGKPFNMHELAEVLAAHINI